MSCSRRLDVYIRTEKQRPAAGISAGRSGGGGVAVMLDVSQLEREPIGGPNRCRVVQVQTQQQSRNRGGVAASLEVSAEVVEARGNARPSRCTEQLEKY